MFGKLIEELNKINIEGIRVRFNGEEAIIKLKIYGVLTDTPAKATVLNMTNFNGQYGCPYCLNPGKKLNFKSSINQSNKINQIFRVV